MRKIKSFESFSVEEIEGEPVYSEKCADCNCNCDSCDCDDCECKKCCVKCNESLVTKNKSTFTREEAYEVGKLALQRIRMNPSFNYTKWFIDVYGEV